MIPRLLRLVPGLLLYGVADAFMVRAGIGVSPWLVFAQGISIHSGISVGLLTNLIGLAVLLLWIPLRQRPGIGTVCNIMLVGPGIELGLWLLPSPDSLWVRIGFFAIGLVLLAVASGIYIGARLGPGPRDGLMTGIHQRFGTPIWVGRTGVEATVLLVGWALGGNAGPGTLAFALLIGPLCGITLPLLDPGARRERRERRTSGAGRDAPQPRKPECETDESRYSTPSTTLL